ncbi:hypothetical protein ZYGR_0AK03710 [Zygosaccharomyces rouxii]|uniref:Transcription regulatory protein SNF12 and Chromatin structure-remodeling complex protein RSC6 n=1 Tax=Zygosaccharomyces rouxii TaxID=4956 RepID=B2G3X1_ZYGRO|nr:hypothetical protein ZYGR_0AK03710 [Zygosaccharomyces rouxii]CAQ43280.1 Transcription regulatory protein SNF12 and Chromatin structure-remodeling complex protein RSC6 [Zygosaccharomyces rouxii]
MSQLPGRFPGRNVRGGGPVPAGTNGVASENGKVPLTASKQTNPTPTTQPTDTYIPTHLSELVPELKSYEQLKESGKRVDVFLARKRIDLQQSVSQWNNSKSGIITSHNKNDVKYLRIFVSNIAENQPWQGDNNDIQNASWTMRVEGRLLDTQEVQDPTRPKFSSFLQAIAVDFKKPKDEDDEEDENSKGEGGPKPEDQDVDMDGPKNESLIGLSLPMQMPGNPNGNNVQEDKPKSDIADAVEWHFDPVNPVDFDGLDIKRNGSENVECTLTIQLKGVTGERLEYSPDLAALIGLSQGSLHEAVYSLYKYILINGLFISGDNSLRTSANSSPDGTNGEKTIVKLDPSLTKLIRQRPAPGSDEPLPTTLRLSEILKLVNAHVSPIRSIKVDYTVRVDKASTYGDLVFDVEVPNFAQQSKDEDEVKKEGLSLLSDFNRLTADLKPQLQELETRNATLLLQLNASAKKYQFFNELSKDPVSVLQEYIASSSNALKVLSGDEGFNEDTVRRSQFYKDNEQMLFESLGVLLSNGRM